MGNIAAVCSKPGPGRPAIHRPSASQRVWIRPSAWLRSLALLALVALALMTILHNSPHEGKYSENSHEASTRQQAQALSLEDIKPAAELPTPQEGLRLILSSHGRLMWYWPDTERVVVLHEAGGVHYGVFPGTVSFGVLESLWFVLRPHNWHAQTAVEELVHVHASTGQVYTRHKVDARFMHDAVRTGQRVFVCSTEAGKILELDYPGMDMRRELSLFTRREHVNTLAPLGAPDTLWVVLHNMGASQLALVNISDAGEGGVIKRVTGVGIKAHGLVSWKDWLLVLDSEGGAINCVRQQEPHDVEQVYQVSETGKFLKGLCVVDDVAYFGISASAKREDRSNAVIDSELGAYDLLEKRILWVRSVPTHGLLNIIAAPQLGTDSTYRALHTSSAASQRTARPTTASNATGQGSKATQQTAQAAARRKDSRKNLAVESGSASSAHNRRMHVNTDHRNSQHITDITDSRGDSDSTGHTDKGGKGDITHISDIQTNTDSPYSTYSQLNTDNTDIVDTIRNNNSKDAVSTKAGVSDERFDGIQDPAVQKVSQQLIDMGFPSKVGGNWSTGLPFLDLESKGSKSGWLAGIQLPLLQVNIQALKAKMEALPPEMWTETYQETHNAHVAGRDSNMNKFKPGCLSMYLKFSDRSIEHVYQYPYYSYFEKELEPIIRQIVGEDGLQRVVRLQFSGMPPGSMIHLHRDMGGYAMQAHRIHIPIILPPEVSFEVCPQLDERKKNSGINAVTDRDVTEPGDCVVIPMAEGMVFEVNNRVLHRVFNQSPNATRVQLVVDVAEGDKPIQALAEGAVCEYVRGVIKCPSTVITPLL